FAIVALCARMLPLDEFAHLGVALAALTVLTCLVDAGVATVIVRDCASRTDRARSFMRASIPVRAPLVGLACAACIAGGLLPGDRVRPREVMRSALPFGLMAFATLLYYRLGTLVLGAAGSASATGSYTVASTLAFGLLMVPNAITSGLLPRLGAQEVEGEQLKA